MMAFQETHQVSVPCPQCGQSVRLTRQVVVERRTARTAEREQVNIRLVTYYPEDDVHEVLNERQLGREEPIVVVVRCRLHETGN